MGEERIILGEENYLVSENSSDSPKQDQDSDIEEDGAAAQTGQARQWRGHVPNYSSFTIQNLILKT